VQQQAIIYFDFLGLHLQEPMAMFWDGLISITSLLFYFQLRKKKNINLSNFIHFFIWMSISTFLGLFGHLFFKYFGFFGKFPSWICISITAYYFCVAILEINQIDIKKWKLSLLLKGIICLILSLTFTKFDFVAIDSVISYMLLGTFLGVKLLREQKNALLWLGTICILPTLFIFGLKINLNRYFNKDDFSHLFIWISLFFYYFCAIKHRKYDI
jgi:hypothetical protein